MRPVVADGQGGKAMAKDGTSNSMLAGGESGMTATGRLMFAPRARLRAPLDMLDASRTGDRRSLISPGRMAKGADAHGEAAVVRMIWYIAEEYPFYGYRRVAAELRRRGLRVNGKRVRRLMHKEGLWAIPPRGRRWGHGNGYRHRNWDWDWDGDGDGNGDGDGDGDGNGNGDGHGDGDGDGDGDRDGNGDGAGDWDWDGYWYDDGNGDESGREEWPGLPDSCPNLLAGLAVDGPDRAWAADMTCIRIGTGFVFLAVVMDLYSRRCLGWSLGSSAHEGHVIRALRKAFRARAGKDLSGLVHHSDNGPVYGSAEYLGLLRSRGIRVSRSRPGYPYENACAERFFRTLKYECAGLCGCQDFEEALEEIGDFIENVYNPGRVHSAIGYMTPEGLEAAVAEG